MKTKHTKPHPLELLKHHVTGAIERGEKQAIESVTAKHTKGEDEDQTPWCSYGHKTKAECDCGPIAEND